jgi:hypothetical protein
VPAAARPAFFEGLENLGPRCQVARARALRASGDAAGALAAAGRVLARVRPGGALPLTVADREAALACYALREQEWAARGEALQAAAEAAEAARLDPTPDRWRAAAIHYADAGRPRESRDAWERAVREAALADASRARDLEAEMLDRLRRAPAGGGR